MTGFSIKKIVVGRKVPLSFGIILVILSVFLNRPTFPFSIIVIFLTFAFIIANLVVLLIRIKRDRISILITIICIILSGLIFWVPSSELFKSKIIIEAQLNDDLSYINLKLRENGKFETTPVTMFGRVETIKGKYKIENDKIIFFDQPYDNDFIPDTITIIEDKIILKFDDKGEPVTSFATFFDILSNNSR